MVNSNYSTDHLDSRKLMEEQLINELKRGLPPSVKLVAYNYSHAGTSLYALLQRKQNRKTPEWLTLRLADHPLWLEETQQVFIEFGNPANPCRFPILKWLFLIHIIAP